MELYQTVSKNARWIYQKSINVKEEAFVKYDVVALGELLIDFTENGTSGQGNPLFEANPGGAPCNVLAMLAKLGHKTAFIGKVGRDFFGEQLKTAIEEVGIFVWMTKSLLH
jgi:hypothetical protein